MPKGKGKAGTKRHEGEKKKGRYDDDPISGITRPVVRKMCRRAYVKRIAGTVYPDVRYFIEQLTKNIVAHSIINMDSHKRKTLKLQDVKSGLETAAGIQLYGVD